MARLTAQEKVLRDREVVADRARGLTWPAIATRHGLSERHVMSLVSDWRDLQPSLSDRDVTQLAEDTIATYDSLVEDLALLALSAGNEAVRLGALRTKLTAVRDRLDFALALGLLPRPLKLVRDEAELRATMDTILDVLDRHGVLTDVVVDEVQAELARDPGAA